jgi:hypothetical protein
MAFKREREDSLGFTVPVLDSPTGTRNVGSKKGGRRSSQLRHLVSGERRPSSAFVHLDFDFETRTASEAGAEWQAFLCKHGDNGLELGQLKNRAAEMWHLVTNHGIDPHVRVNLWMTWSGASKRQSQKNYTDHVMGVGLSSSTVDTGDTFDLIERDLHRTCPQHPFFQVLFSSENCFPAARAHDACFVD